MWNFNKGMESPPEVRCVSADVIANTRWVKKPFSPEAGTAKISRHPAPLEIELVF
jgi:hypothetical protein